MAKLQKKFPSGVVWASSNKPDGHLRISILLDLGKSTGDKLPKGAFDDPDISNPIHDEVAGIKVAEHVQSHLDGMRDDVDETENQKYLTPFKLRKV